MPYHVSEAVIRRLPSYYRHLTELEAEGINQISSYQLGIRLQYTASQVRQDMGNFGKFGRPGSGYDVKWLRKRIAVILGINREHSMIIIGAGNIGRAIAGYPTFRHNGFKIVSIFDVDQEKVGRTIAGIPVFHINELEPYLDNAKIDIGVLALPAIEAQQMLDILIKKGIMAIWNFAPTDLRAGMKSVAINNVHLSESLQLLSCKMRQAENCNDKKKYL